MKLSLNGEPHDCNHETLSALLSTLKLLEKRIAVEFNGEICPRSEWATQKLSEGDEIEVVQAIGGG